MSFYGWNPYVPVAARKAKAAKLIAGFGKKGSAVAPVTIEGRKIATSFWGKAWCDNLERYSDYETRLPRGRSYVRNGLVVDLQLAKGEVAALVSGSSLYKVKISIKPAAATRWKDICRDCAGTIDSLVELLQGRLAKSVMDRVCREGDGLFPAPNEIKLSCSCPDWADMCKHVAAALYGVGARLDEKPQLLFVLRGVDESELLAGAGPDLARSKSAPGSAKVLDDSDVAALFGLEMVENTNSDIPAPSGPKPSRPSKGVNGRKSAKGRKAAASPTRAAKRDDPPTRARSKAGSKRKAKAPAGKKPARARTKLST